jgi:hypothetical protein
VAVDENRLRVAVVEASKKQIVVKQLISQELPRSYDDTTTVAAKNDAVEDFDDLIFGEEEKEGTITETIDTEWDMTEEGVGESFAGDSNESLMANILTGIHPKSVNVGLAIPVGVALYQIFKDSDYRKRKKKEVKELITDRLRSVYTKDITADNYATLIRDSDGALIVSSFDGENHLLNIADAALALMPGKLFIRDIKPEELLLVGMVNANYDILEHEYSVLIHIQDRHTQVIIMQGSQIVGILPTINEGSKSNRVMKTIFSKLLFELDRGQLPTIDRIVLTGDTVKNKAVTFLEEQFMEVQIGMFQFNPLKVILPEDFTDDVLPYITAIASAWSASGNDVGAFPKISLIPQYVSTRQAVFKLDWHGYILLLLIAGFPFTFNLSYQEKISEVEDLKTTISALNQQISENRVLSTVVDQLMSEVGIMNVNTNLLDTLSKDTQLWSYTLSMLNSEVANIRGVWIQNIQFDNNTFVLQGFSLYRDRIPQISNLFDNAVIQQVVEKEERETKIYEFVIQVHRITRRSELISPIPVEPPTLDIGGQEQGRRGGIIQN